VADYFSEFESWSPTEHQLWDRMWNDDDFHDPTAEALYHNGFYNFDVSTEDRVAIREALSSYLSDEYGIDFEAQFDWEAWREAYENA
jgi:hypothetical protein